MSTLRKNVRLLSWFNFFVNFEPHMPIAIIYFSQVTGSFALGMMVYSIFMISSSILEVPTGVLSDSLGRKKTMMLGGIAGTLSVVCYAYAEAFFILAIGSVFEGLMFALYSGNNNAFLHDTLKQEGREDDYSHYLGRTSSMFQIGLGTSALLGSAIAFAFSLRMVFWVGVLPRFMCVVVSLFIAEPKVHDAEPSTNIFKHLSEAFSHFRKNVRLRTLSIASILDFGLGQVAFMFNPTFFALLWPSWAIGLARSISHITAFTSFWFAGCFIKRFAPLKVLIGIKGGSHTVSLIAYSMPSIISPILISCLSLGYGVKMVAENTLLQREFTNEQRATMGSLNQFAGSILFAVSAFCIGSFADIVGPRKTLILIEVILFFGLYLYWKVFHHERKES